MDQTATIEEIDITRAVRAHRWAGNSRAVARLVWLFGAPLSAWAIAGWILQAQSAYTFSAGLSLAFLIYLILLPVVLLGLNFAILSLRPILALAFVALGAGPAVLTWNRYLLSMDNEVWGSVFYSGAYAGVFAFPFLATFVLTLSLTREMRAMARPAPPMRTPLALLREMFSIWPGMKRSALSAGLGSLLYYAAAVPISLAWLAIPPIVFLALSLAPVFLSTHGPGEVVMQAGAIILLIWLTTAGQSLFRSGARWLTRASFDEQVGRDARAPILFLRSFQDDQVRLTDPSRVVRVLRAVFTLGFGVRRLDHILVEGFSRYGPSLALGSPGEKDLPFGAARVYVTHDTWKAKVAEVAARARSVVLVADQTPGVEWEIKTFMRGDLREKTLFICAPKSGDVRGNPVMGRRMDELGVTDTGQVIIAAWWRADGTLRLLRTSLPPSPETIVVALNAFFREQDGEMPV